MGQKKVWVEKSRGKKSGGKTKKTGDKKNGVTKMRVKILVKKKVQK